MRATQRERERERERERNQDWLCVCVFMDQREGGRQRVYVPEKESEKESAVINSMALTVKNFAKVKI